MLWAFWHPTSAHRCAPRSRRRSRPSGKSERNEPSRVSGRLSEHIHIYVDASFNHNGYCGVGGVAYSSSGECLGFFSEVVKADALNLIMVKLETSGLLTGFKVFEKQLEGRKAVVFTDSEAVRGAFLKSWSRNQQCDRVILALLEAEEKLQLQVWLERVPSQSNPTAVFSREIVESFSGMTRTTCDVHAV